MEEAVRRLCDAYPELAAEFERTQKDVRKPGWEKAIPSFRAEKPQATRNAGGAIMNAIADAVPELFGGAADLTTSTKTIFKSGESFHVDPAGRNVFFGVREFGMCAAVNGMAAHGGLVPFGSTFFCSRTTAKPAIRLAALMQISFAVYLYARLDCSGRGRADASAHRATDDAARGSGADGLPPRRCERNCSVWRLALERTGPCFFALTRQDLPVIDPATHDVYGGVSKGAYVLEDAPNPQVVLIGTGSEVWPAVEAAKMLAAEGIAARVVSFPSWKIFEEQTAEYKASVLPAGVPKLAVEAGATLGWWKYVGQDGDVIGLDRFGASAPGRLCWQSLDLPRRMWRRGRRSW